MRGHVQPTRFFLKGSIALVVLFLVTLMLAPAPEVNALRAFIAVGLVITVGKMLLRHYNVNWPPKRN
jgi:hypothetical protein